MSHKIHNGCRELWVQVAWQACHEARARLDVARSVPSGHRDCQVLNSWTRIRPFDHELSRITAYFRGEDWRMVCQMAGLRCNPEGAIRFALGEHDSDRRAA